MRIDSVIGRRWHRSGARGRLPTSAPGCAGDPDPGSSEPHSWDREFGRARFEIGYYDRLEPSLIRVPFESAHFRAGEHFFFEIAAPDGAVHSVPLHRVRAVWRNGVLVWRRPD